MNRTIDHIKANTEITRCLASLRNIIDTIGDTDLMSRIVDSLPHLEKLARDKRFDLRRKRKTVESK